MKSWFISFLLKSYNSYILSIFIFEYLQSSISIKYLEEEDGLKLLAKRYSINVFLSTLILELYDWTVTSWFDIRTTGME